MALWLVRAGREGEVEDFAIEKGFAVISWDELPDLKDLRSREQLHAIMRDTYPDAKPNTILNWTGQVWTFRSTISQNDHVVLPLKTRAAVAIGKVVGPYQYRTDIAESVRHVRPVKWLRTDLPRSVFDQDLLYSLGAFMTVCRIQRNDAERRILALVSDARTSRSPDAPSPFGMPDAAVSDDGAPHDVATAARDQIRKFISERFRRKELERLVNGILTAQGYRTQRGPGSADGGADIIAGRGPMGFDPPRLCVQVKSGDKPVDVKPLRELQGVMRQFGAEQGLLVSWSGFTTAVHVEARKLFFEIRLWDSDDLLAALADAYEDLSEELQTEIPLQRVWTLVPDPARE